MEIGELHGVLQLCLSGDVAQRKAGEDRLKQVTMFSVASMSSLFCSETGAVYEARPFFIRVTSGGCTFVFGQGFFCICRLFGAVQGFKPNR